MSVVLNKNISSTAEPLSRKYILKNLCFNNKSHSLTVFSSLNRSEGVRMHKYRNLSFYAFFSNSNYIKGSNTSLQLYSLKNDTTIFLENSSYVSCVSDSLDHFSFYLFGSTRFNSLALFNNLSNYISKLIEVSSFNYFFDVHFVGVGYKVFKYKDYLYIRLGFSKMVKLKIPKNLAVLVRRRSSLKVISFDKQMLSKFCGLLLGLRSFDKYKGKGVYFLPSFEGIQLKVGKKQQFF